MAQPQWHFEYVKSPTGKARGRLGRFGKVILQIEELIVTYRSKYPNSREECNRQTAWRDAKADDLIQQTTYGGLL